MGRDTLPRVSWTEETHGVLVGRGVGDFMGNCRIRIRRVWGGYWDVMIRDIDTTERRLYLSIRSVKALANARVNEAIECIRERDLREDAAATERILISSAAGPSEDS